MAPQLCTAHPRGPSQNIPIRASKGMTCPDLGEIGFGRGRAFSQVVFPAPLLLVWTFRFGGIYLVGAFGVATLATGARFGRGLLTAGTPSPSPFDRTNCALDDDSPLGFAVILSPHEGEGWAVGCFPGQFLRRTELIKRSLRLDDEPTWWCQEPLQLRCRSGQRPRRHPCPAAGCARRWQKPARTTSCPRQDHQ